MIMKRNNTSLVNLLFVLVIHGGFLYVLWNQRLIPPPEDMVTLFVSFVTPPKVEEIKTLVTPLLPIKPRLVKKLELPQLVVKEPVLSETETVVPSLPPSVAVEAVALKPAPIGQITLPTELSVTCPEWVSPSYPPLSRRLGEEGKLLLRVELDEDGRVSNAQVIESSNYKRLDDVALITVKTWRCNPSIRNGQRVRAVALQPFNFVLQGH
ncbi:hypothetical protein LBMAG32_05650 [Nitrosomonadaceae bacterium]|nr:hypothetical protein LBMAG32_05650 [Nitrosomonadaceae bacterium]